MKKSEILEDIEAEMLHFYKNYQIANDEAKPHVSRNAAADLLDMLLGMGMLPPERFNTPIKNQTCQWEEE